MTIDKPDMLLWMDVETTGLDPDRDRILEVEMRCTDMATLRDSLEAAGWDVKPEEETPAASAHRTGTCLDRDIRQYARIIRHLSDHPVRYVATEAAR